MPIFFVKRLLSRLIGLGLVVLIALSGCQEPPKATIEKAREAILKARRNDAGTFAAETYELAEKIFQEGQMEVARQNGRLAPFRNYARADSLLEQAYLIASKASTEANEYRRQLESEAESQKQTFHDDLNAWRKALDGTLTLYSAERYWSLAEMSLEVCEKLFAAGEFEKVIKEVNRGQEYLVSLSSVVEEKSGDELQKMDLWRLWIDSTLSLSRRTCSCAVIVDKSKHKLYLLSAGKIIGTYACDLGYNSVHQKMVSGDGATPEGMYRVTQIRLTGSKYHKALLLNYPNERDKKRFAANKAQGIISEEARIGGLIEIHGEGGRNKDWTEGCVALANTDMDKLVKFVEPGTTVAIVRKADRWP
jgi:hypothetical protein